MPEAFEQKIRSSGQTIKERKALELTRKIESIMKKEKKSVEDYERIIKLLKEIGEIIKIKVLKNKEIRSDLF